MNGVGRLTMYARTRSVRMSQSNLLHPPSLSSARFWSGGSLCLSLESDLLDLLAIGNRTALDAAPSKRHSPEEPNNTGER